MEERIKRDIFKLKQIAQNINVKDNIILLDIKGPKDSLYENGIWKIVIHISKDYPFTSPSVGFVDKIYHPNIDLRSGTICLNTLNETWSPIYNLSHIYNIFIPQLLLYPNANDPLNEAAADLYINDMDTFKQKVKEYLVFSH
jgi:ubiquitin-conjugating enzyme E2 H|tara:strand:- start:1262 stop:1687 length:426 start_codon:yes stop_codon:yes gene_type:complete